MNVTRVRNGFLAAASWLCLVGCQEAVPRTQPSIHMVPTEARLVGGGTDIDFTAPESGIAFLYDWSESKAVLSRSLQKGETLKIRKGAVVESTGVATAADPGLYFLPERALWRTEGSVKTEREATETPAAK
jgi:hypothetical protein